MIYDLQKASFWKRASAFLFDIVIMMVVVVGIASLMSIALKYELHYGNLEREKDVELQKIEAEYGCELDLSVGYSDMTDPQKEMYDNIRSYVKSFRTRFALTPGYSQYIQELEAIVAKLP